MLFDSLLEIPEIQTGIFTELKAPYVCALVLFPGQFEENRDIIQKRNF